MSLRLALLTALLAVAAAGAAWRDGKGLIHRDDSEWCDDVLGCLTITDEWFSPMRPINPFPASRSSINTRFMLHTREDRAFDADVFIVAGDEVSVASSTFDPSKPIKFISHGFIDTANSYWLPQMAETMLNYGDFNVFRVNWGAGSLPMYSKAAANARVVGLEIAYLVNWFITKYGVDPANVHLLGHSLGAHASGYAGELITGLGRISGFDPAGPYYTSMPNIVRIDPSDAVFVDNIHTDADSIVMLGYGTGQPMGNLDFYPNSGHDQPGCDPVSIAIDLIMPSDVVGDVRDIVACSHIRSVFLFEDTMKSPSCNFLGHQCFDYDTFLAGSCSSCGADNSKCAIMGIRADEYVDKTRTNAMFFLATVQEAPFCLQHYQVSMLTAHPSNAEDWVVGRIYASLYGETGQILERVMITDQHRRIDHGTVNNFLFTSHMDLGNIMRIEFEWQYDDEFLKPGTYCWSLFCNRNLYVQSVQISPINYYPESERLSHTQLFCTMDGSEFEIKDGKSVSVAPTGACTAVA